MEKSNLIDMFGLTGDGASDDQLDDLLCRLEADIQRPERLVPVVFEPSRYLMRIGKGSEEVIVSLTTSFNDLFVSLAKAAFSKSG